MSRVSAAAATILVGVSTALVIGAAAVILFLNPVWVAFAQGRAEAAAWTGFTEAQLRQATDAILADLVFGPPDFDVMIDGVPVLNERERGHMQDVRGVFAGFYAAAVAGAVVLVSGWMLARDRSRFWRRVSGGAFGLAVGTIVIGGLGVVFFDAAFELFHRLFFAEGSWTFDPATERLVQLFPYQFWMETTIALGVVLVVAGIAVGWLARRRSAALAGRAAAAAEGGPAEAAGVEVTP